MKRGIYKITNPEGKIYIGLSNDIENRWKQYKNQRGNGNDKLYKSIQEHGYSNHQFEIIEEILINENLDIKSNSRILRERERYWIEVYNSNIDGLNQNKGGCGPGSHSSISKDKISESLKGKSKPEGFAEKRNLKHSEETKLKISEAKKGKSSSLKGKKGRSYSGRISPNKGKLGKTRNEETCNKISNSNRGRKISEDTKNKISKANTGKIRSKEVKQRISNSAKGIKKPGQIRPNRARSIDQLDKNGKFIKNWISIKEASIQLNLQMSNIVKVLKGIAKSAGGFIFTYSNKVCLP